MPLLPLCSPVTLCVCCVNACDGAIGFAPFAPFAPRMATKTRSRCVTQLFFSCCVVEKENSGAKT